MAISNSVNLDLSLAFPRAGVAFAIEARAQDGGADEGPSTFRVSVSDASTGRAVPLTGDASPQLADWVRGYTRWLARASEFVEDTQFVQPTQQVTKSARVIEQRQKTIGGCRGYRDVVAATHIVADRGPRTMFNAFVGLTG